VKTDFSPTGRVSTPLGASGQRALRPESIHYLAVSAARIHAPREAGHIGRWEPPIRAWLWRVDVYWSGLGYLAACS